MKKLAIIIMAALLALVICAAALAGDQNARDLYDSAAKLLFWTNNATVNVTADFSLDGEWFKTAEVTLKQDQNRSLHRLFLRSPKADGTERKNGYTVVINDEKLFLMEVFTPGVYRSGTTTERDSILRRSAESGLMLQLGYALAGQADTLLGSGALTKEADGSYSLKLSGEIPLIVDAAAGQFFRFAAKRYFDVDFDTIDANDYVKMDSYTTTSAGLISVTRDVSVREIAVTLKTDAEGRLQHAEGTAGFYISTMADGVRQLDITFKADVSDVGSTVLKKFDPADYNVVRAEDDGIFFSEYGEEVSEEETSYGETLPENGALIDSIEMKAMEIWAETGYNTVSTTSVGCQMLQDCYEVSLQGGYDETLKSYFRWDGEFMSIVAEPNAWQQAGVDEYNYDAKPDAQTDSRAKEFLKEFLAKANPELAAAVQDLKMEWSYEAGGAIFAQYHEEPMNADGNGVLFVIRTSPEMRIEYYSSVSNG